MKNPIERMLEEHREHLNPHYLFSVSNQDIDEKHRKKTMIPGHMAEGFIFNKNYLVEYVGPNAKSTPALREEKEKAALELAQTDLQAVQKMLMPQAVLSSESIAEESTQENYDAAVSHGRAINSVPSKEDFGPKFLNPRR